MKIRELRAPKCQCENGPTDAPCRGELDKWAVALGCTVSEGVRRSSCKLVLSECECHHPFIHGIESVDHLPQGHTLMSMLNVDINIGRKPRPPRNLSSRFRPVLR